MAAILPAPDSAADASMTESKPQLQSGGQPPVRKRMLPWADAVFAGLTQGAAWLTLILLVGILISLLIGAAPAIQKFGLSFLWTSDWDPVQEKFGGLVMIYGTLMTSLIALVIAVPISFGIALFLTELSPNWLRRPLGIAIVGGLMVSQMLTLYTTPVVYLYMDRFRAWVGGGRAFC